MNVSLTPALEKMIHKKVESGAYASASEVVREALRRLQAEERQLELLRDELQIGLDQLERGKIVEYSPDFMQRLMQDASDRMQSGHRIKDVVKP